MHPNPFHKHLLPYKGKYENRYQRTHAKWLNREYVQSWNGMHRSAFNLLLYSNVPQYQFRFIELIAFNTFSLVFLFFCSSHSLPSTKYVDNKAKSSNILSTDINFLRFVCALRPCIVLLCKSTGFRSAISMCVIWNNNKKSTTSSILYGKVTSNFDFHICNFYNHVILQHNYTHSIHPITLSIKLFKFLPFFPHLPVYFHPYLIRNLCYKDLFETPPAQTICVMKRSK